MHAIVFSLSSISIAIFGLYRPYKGTFIENILLYLMIFSGRLLADYITSLHGKSGTTAVRGEHKDYQKS